MIIYTTTKTKTQAKKLILQLLKNKLIACANIFPIESMYWWESTIQNEKETAILLKTNLPFKSMEKEIKKLHPYKLPCIEKINTECNKEFSEWIDQVL